jgi:RNase P/RNase MRP subunit POP5
MTALATIKNTNNVPIETRLRRTSSSVKRAIAAVKIPETIFKYLIHH